MQYSKAVKAAVALSAIAASLAVVCSAGQTYARYENYAQWRAPYEIRAQQLCSDQLTLDGQTVLLSDWTVENTAVRMSDIHLRTDAGTVEATLRCQSDLPQYLTAELERTQVTVNDQGVQIPLTLTPTDAALALTQQVTAHVRVELLTDGPQLWADYQVKLLPVQTQPEQTEPEETQPVQLQITGADAFAWTEMLALSVTAAEQADTLVLGMQGGEFPEGTCYHANGQTVLLADDRFIELPISGTQEQTLLLDFSRLEQPQTDSVTLQAQTQYQQALTGTAEWTAATNRQPLTLDMTGIDPVLTGNGVLRVPLCADTQDLVWRLEMLTETESGIAYTESDEQFYLVVTVDRDSEESGTFITVSNAGGLAPAGTYRLTLERMYQEQILSSTQLQFFVCY